MTHPTSGYVEDIAYTFGYCDELNPLRARLPLLQAGFAAPVMGTACELGFGHGVSANLHAAGSATRWFGTDFNASHARFAQDLAAASGARACMYGESFEEFCNRPDLPDFDFIGLHGTWSWISEANRELLVDFMARKLKPGGVVYMGYNAQPGWTSMLPVRELMYRHFEAQVQSGVRKASAETGSIEERIDGAVKFAQSVFAAQPGYALLNPMLAARVDALGSESAAYLAHEYFNCDWHPMFFSQVATALGRAGLTFAASADYRDSIDEINFSDKQISLINDYSDTELNQTMRDLCVNRSFRRDYWVKSPRKLDSAERHAALAEHRVILALPRASVVLKVRGALGETALPAALYDPILDALVDHVPATLKEIEERARIPLPRIVEAVMLLIGMGALLNAQDEAAIHIAIAATDRLNAAICEQALRRADVQFLASSVSASGISVPRIAQLFLLAKARGLSEPRQWAAFAAEVLADSDPDAELETKANRFASEYLPVLKALGIG